jgi:hypothetical protein
MKTAMGSNLQYPITKGFKEYKHQGRIKLFKDKAAGVSP